MTPANPVTNPPLPPINRRSSTPLPGLSTTASLIRNRRSSNVPAQSSLRKVHSSKLPEDDEDDDEDASTQLKSTVDQNQLEELRKGIIMPGMGGNRANTESHSDPRHLPQRTDHRPYFLLRLLHSIRQLKELRQADHRRLPTLMKHHLPLLPRVDCQLH